MLQRRNVRYPLAQVVSERCVYTYSVRYLGQRAADVKVA